MGIQGDGLDGLPTELLCNIFRLAIGREDTKRNRSRLMLVCRKWRDYIEDSALLWTDIDALDGLANMRRALERSKGVVVDLRYWIMSGLRSPFNSGLYLGLEAFMVEAGPHIARWRSLVVGVARPPSSESLFATLTTTPAPSLEILEISFVNPGDWMSGNTVTLFGGAPAPSTLKELTLHRIPVAIEPLKLSGLVSLELTGEPVISTPQLLEILHRCPSLERLSLGGTFELEAIGPQAPNIRPIELPKLDSLTLTCLPPDTANCILSNIRIPNRRCVLIRADMSEGIFTSTTAHLLHTTLPTADIPSSSAIVVGTRDYNDYMIKFHGIEIILHMNEEDRIQEILRWMADGLGSEAAEYPIHLILGSPYGYIINLAVVPPPLIVKHLSISDAMSESLREGLYLAMARAPDPTSSGWLYPHLESLRVIFKSIESQERLVSMLKSRYEGGSAPGETGLRGLRSVELRGSPRTEGLVEEIKGILGEADVFWAEEETS